MITSVLNGFHSLLKLSLLSNSPLFSPPYAYIFSFPYRGYTRNRHMHKRDVRDSAKKKAEKRGSSRWDPHLIFLCFNYLAVGFRPFWVPPTLYKKVSADPPVINGLNNHIKWILEKATFSLFLFLFLFQAKYKFTLFLLALYIYIYINYQNI